MSHNTRESRLLALAAVFLFLYSVALSLAPAARLRSWQADFPWQHWAGFAAWLVVFGTAAFLGRKKLPGHDPYLLPITGLLTGWGLLTIFRLFPESGWRQTAWLLVGGAIYLVGIHYPVILRLLRRYKYLWLTLGLALTGLTLVLGTNPLGFGPRMWLGCCGLYLQPSEPLKFLLVVYLAAYLADRLPLINLPAGRSAPTQPAPGRRSGMDSQDGNDRRSASRTNRRAPFTGSMLPLVAPTLVMTGLALGILLVQRDLGTASIFLFVYFAILYVATGRKIVLGTALAVLVVFGAIGYWMFDLVRLRIDAWLNPWLDPSGRSYQIVQSLLAVANGGILGRGPGVGNPGLVPVPHSDFIFASISEETGLLGAVGILLLLALIVDRGLRLALSAPNAYQRYLATGLTALIVSQAVLIIGGNLRLLPLTGVTLPFVSYGGSSLVVSFLALLILMLISSQPESRPAYLPNPENYLQLGGFLLAGLAAAVLVTAWWAVYRGPSLLTRTDNPRRALADRYVARGALLDRNNELLNETTGVSGSYTRQNMYAPLSNIIGYTHPVYGQSGLEAGLDPYLRGLDGNSALSIWINHLLYGQPPPGLDVRLSLDLGMQRATDRLLGETKGAAVLLNAENGEILSMASHPTFDANQLDSQWEELIKDPDSPLLNRATQGAYLTGSGLSPALAAILTGGNPPGDPAAEILPNPLQMALAAAALTNGGLQPASQIALALETPSAGWLPLSTANQDNWLPEGAGLPIQALSAQEAAAAIQNLTATDNSGESGNFWENVSCTGNLDDMTGENQDACWYVAGTLPEWQGTPLALAVVIENHSPEAVRQIGRQIMLAAMQP